jgi:phosphatidylserine/phosphatidylglycerophosphate/cardiolipin synthase-like enzyme
LRAGFDRDAVKLPFRLDSPQWPKLLGTAAASGLATLFVSRIFPDGEESPPSHQGQLRCRRRHLRSHHRELARTALVEGNKVTPLENGDQIFPAMLSGIRSAQRTITFKNFLFREGEISDDRIGERNNQRNEREHHSKSALLLGSFYICRKTVPIPKVPSSKRLGSNADSAPK